MAVTDYEATFLEDEEPHLERALWRLGAAVKDLEPALGDVESDALQAFDAMRPNEYRALAGAMAALRGARGLLESRLEAIQEALDA